MPYKIIISKIPYVDVKNYIDAEIGWDAVATIRMERSTSPYDPFDYHLNLNSIFLAKKTAAKFKTTWQKVDEEKGA